MNVSKFAAVCAMSLGAFALAYGVADAATPIQTHLGVGPQLATDSEYLVMTSAIKDGKLMAVSNNYLIGGQVGNGAQKEFLGACIEADGTVSTTKTLVYKSNLKRWALQCANGAELVTSQKDKFYSRSKAGVQNRGSLHPLTATYVSGGKRRILCLASMPNEQSIPGYMDIPARGRIPSECKIKFGGNTVGVKNWRVYEGLTSTEMSKYNTWWSTGGPMSSSSVPPLFAYRIDGNQLLCSGTDRATGQGHPGVVSGGKCLISANFWTVQHTNEPKQMSVDTFGLYLAQRNPALTWSAPGTSIPSDALDFNRGNKHRPGRVVACRRAGYDKLGYVAGSANNFTCKVPGATGTGPFRVLVAPGSDRG